jgi:hypothetical protein
VIFEIQEQIQNLFNPITSPVETWSISACSQMLQPALYKHEILQHHWQCVQHWKRNSSRPDYYSDTDPEPAAEIDEQTSDEEGIEPQKARVIQYIQQIEKRMYELICHDYRQYNQPHLNEGMIKGFAPQLH